MPNPCLLNPRKPTPQKHWFGIDSTPIALYDLDYDQTRNVHHFGIDDH